MDRCDVGLLKVVSTSTMPPEEVRKAMAAVEGDAATRLAGLMDERKRLQNEIQVRSDMACWCWLLAIVDCGGCWMWSLPRCAVMMAMAAMTVVILSVNDCNSSAPRSCVGTSASSRACGPSSLRRKRRARPSVSPSLRVGR